MKSKKLKIIMIIIAAAVVVAGGIIGGILLLKPPKEDKRFKLSTPKDFYTQDGYLIWNNVSGAEYYVVMADGETQTTTENRISLDSWPSRVCDFYVKACNDDEEYYTHSDYGDIKEVMVETPGLKFRLGSMKLSTFERGEYYEVWQGDADLSSGILVLPAEKDGLPVLKTSGYGKDGNEPPFKSDDLTEVYIPEGFYFIASASFCLTPNLKTVHVPQSLKTISSYAFANTSIEKIELPGVGILNLSAFDNCAQLKEVYIGPYATECTNPFTRCGNLKTVTVSEENPNLKVVDNMLIQNVKDGKWLVAVWDTANVIVPDYVTGIYSYALDGTTVKEIYIPASFTDLKNDFTYRSSNFEKITVEEGNPVFFIKDNCLLYNEFDYGGRFMGVGIQCIIGKLVDGTFTVPEGVTFIRRSLGRKDLKILNITEGVESIEDDAFSGSINLEKVNYPEKSLRRVSGAFSGCPVEAYLPYPESVKNV